MGSRFAGAQDHADRRRRLIASDEPGNTTPLEAAFEQATAFDQSVSEPFAPELDLVRHLIFPELWKHLVTLAVLLGGVISIGYWAHSNPTDVNFGHAVISPDRLVDASAGIMLLLAGQLALLTGWLRSRSEVDFQGRYRGWKWMAVASCVLAGILLTGTTTVVPLLLSNAIEYITGPLQAARPAILLLTCITGAMLILGRILPDMGRCLYSQSLLVVAVLSTVVRFMLMHGTTQASIGQSIFHDLTLLSSFATFAAMLLHCRFVAFVCNDPPQQFIVQSKSELPEPATVEPEQVTSKTESPVPAIPKETPPTKKRTPRRKSGKAA